MKKFKFKYEKILQVRIEKENSVRNNLAKINNVIQTKVTEKQELELSYHAFLQSIEAQMTKGIRASELQSISHNKTYLVDKLEILNQELTTLNDQRRIIQEELVEANKQRKVMEKIKEKEIENYKSLEALEEAKIVDQIVTYQSTKNRGE